MKYKQPRVLTILSLLVITVLLLPHAARSEDEVSMDDALLLMIAGQSRMYDGEYLETAFSVPGLGAVDLDFSSQGASQEQINEQRQLGKVYSRWANQLSASDSSRQFFRDKADQHFDQAEELAKARRRFLRRKNNIFGKIVRTVGRPIGKLFQGIFQGGRFVFRGLGKVGQVAVTIAKDEVIFRAKQIIRTKIQDLIDLSQGKLDSVVARIAKKAGWPAAELFREIVLAPGFRRVERAINRAVDQALGQGSQSATRTPAQDPSEPDDPDHTTDWDNVDEEGDTDYDDQDPAAPTPANNRKKPLNFQNMGQYDASVVLTDREWYVGYDSFGVAGNSSDSIQVYLLPGSYQFCFQWKLGEETVWSLTGSYTVLPDATEDPNAAQTVFLDTNTGNYSPGTCQDRPPNQYTTTATETAPAPEDTLVLTPEEKSNQGTHGYQVSCTFSEGEPINDGPWTYSWGFDQSSTGAKIATRTNESGEQRQYTQISGNTYVDESLAGLYEELTFFSGGFQTNKTYDDGQTSTCTYTK